MVIDVEQRWTRLYCKTLNEVEAAIKDKRFIHSQIVLGVKRMIEFRSTTDMCLEVWCIETYSSVWVSIRLADAVNSLQKILDYRVEEEEYEDCQEIVDLLEAVEVLTREKALPGPQDLKKTGK
jgi:hypothetical protein